jgi:hypothetical protein
MDDALFGSSNQLHQISLSVCGHTVTDKRSVKAVLVIDDVWAISVLVLSVCLLWCGGGCESSLPRANERSRPRNTKSEAKSLED